MIDLVLLGQSECFKNYQQFRQNMEECRLLHFYTLVKYKFIKVSFGEEPIPLYDVFLIHCFSWPEIERSTYL